MEIFGIKLTKKKSKPNQVASVVSPPLDDGAALVSAANYYGISVDLDGSLKNENLLIQKYRETCNYPDCDSAVEDIINESIVNDGNNPIVKISLAGSKISESIKTKISDEFNEVLKLLKFSDRAHDIFRTWYVDGKLYYNILIDDKDVKNGITELRYIDPLKIRKIRTVKTERTPTGVDVNTNVEEYYLFNDKGLTTTATQGVRLSSDSVAYCGSGLIDPNTGVGLSYLNKAIKPTNQLKMIEDALVIYRVSRAPERRIFYIDVGNLPKVKAEQYVQDIMNKFRNKLVYDANTGEIKDDKKHLSMMEDFWMPRREGGKGTEITTLDGAQNLGQIEDINYFQNKLFQALNVPLSRLKPDMAFSIGASATITRDEVKFAKFISRLRSKFSHLFSQVLRVQLILKGVIREDEWDDLLPEIKYIFAVDNHYAELKETEIIQNRIATLNSIDMFVGKYYSIEWVRKNVLMQTDEEIKDINKQIKAEPEPAPEQNPQ